MLKLGVERKRAMRDAREICARLGGTATTATREVQKQKGG